MKKNYLLLFWLFLLCNGLLFAQANLSEIIVRFQEGHRANSMIDFDLPNTITKEIISERYNIVLYQYDADRITFEELKQNLAGYTKDIKWIAPNRVNIQLRDSPNDSLYNQQWAFSNMDIEPFWAKTKGGVTPNGDTIVVALMEKGFSMNHPDLRENYWHNYLEIPDDGIDNDENGYIDDFTGWNSPLSNDKYEYHPHGAQVSGILGAKSNNIIGIANQNWNIKLMPISWGKPSTSHTTNTTFFSHIFTSFEYIIKQRELYNSTNGEKGSFIVAVNESFGIDSILPLAHQDQRYRQWCEYMDALGEVGVLTIAASPNKDYDVDIIGDMPTTCPQDFLIATLAIKEDDEKFGAYGSKSIDLAAPGANILTTNGEDSYKYAGGTSMASPQVASAVALIYSFPCERWGHLIKTNPSQAALQVKEWILQNTKSTPSVRENTTSGGSLNLGNIIDDLDFFCEGNPLESLALKIYPTTTNHLLKFEYDLPKFGTFTLQASNILGQVIFAEKYTSDKAELQKGKIDVSFFPSGLYFLTIIQDEKSDTQKFIKR